MEDDRDYYRRRAEKELELAQASNEPTAVRAHYQLANYYLEWAYGSVGTSADEARDGRPPAGRSHGS